MAMTPFEKALLGELKGIRRELQKMNKINDDKKVKIPPPRELTEMQFEDQFNKLKKSLLEQQKEAQIEEIQNAVYDPLSRS